MTTSTRDPDGPAELRARVLAAVDAAPSPTRRALATRTAIAVVVVSTSLLGFALTGAAMRGGGHGWWASGAVLMLAAACVTALKLGAGGRLLGWGALVPLLGLPITALWVEDPFATLPIKTHVACVVMTLVVGVLGGGLLAFARRGTEPVAAGRAGLSLGLVAGAWAAASVALRCGHPEIDHTLGSHVAPVLVLCLLGVVAGKRVLGAGASATK